MDIRKLQRTIVDALEDVKAQDIQVFNTEALTSLFDRVIVASGSSNRQTRALAASVRDQVRAAGGTVKNPEGEGSGEWVLVDCGDAVVHIMQPVIRAYYKLEDIWGGKNVHLKAKQDAAALAATKAARSASPGAARSAKASSATAAKRIAPAKKPAAKRAGANPAPTRNAASKVPAKRGPWPGKTKADTGYTTDAASAAKPRAKSPSPAKTAGSSGAKPRATSKTVASTTPAPRKRAASRAASGSKSGATSSSASANSTARNASKPAVTRRAAAKKTPS
uniref:Ribosomal silencing factor RsfS n=1 Tax=mine drainage metagenome TaxID=410659 RepID=E6PMX5_9ZZZZ